MKRRPSPFSRLSLLTAFLFFTLPAIICSQPLLRDSLDLVTFLDGLMEAHLEEAHIAGATVSVVQNGRLLFAKGYGYADLEKRQPVEPEKTLFRVGSISKLFVWTAVMQLVEQGKLDLETDINHYLGRSLQVPETYEQPITLKHLMTHTPGFEERILGLFAQDAEALRPLDKILQQEMPARVRPPGAMASYSNHGTGLAAFIVEQVAGLSFHDYVERYILGPLRMRHSTFRQPLPDSLARHLSNGYSFRDGAFQEEHFEYVPLYPVGAMSATATDMARFMLAHLQSGSYGGAAILDSTTTALMHSPAFRHAPGLPPTLYGFYRMDRNGKHIFGHGGDTFWFHSLLALLPEDSTGIFLSFNSEGGGGIANKVLDAVADRYFPSDQVALEAASDQPSNPERFAGQYRSIRYPHHRFSKVMALMGPVTVEGTADGCLKTKAGEETRRWVQISPLIFREENGTARLAFQEDGQGKTTHLFIGEVPILAFEKIPTLERPSVATGILGGVLLIFLLTLTGWAVGARLRSKYQVANWQSEHLLPTTARWIGWLTALSLVLFHFGFAILMADDPQSIVYGIPQELVFLSVLPLLSLVLTAILFIFTLWIWGQGKGTLRARLWYTLLTLACMLAVYQLWQWKFLSFFLYY